MQKPITVVSTSAPSAGSGEAAPVNATSGEENCLSTEHAAEAMTMIPRDFYNTPASDAAMHSRVSSTPEVSLDFSPATRTDEAALEQDLDVFERVLSSAVNGHLLETSSGRAGLVIATLFLSGKSYVAGEAGEIKHAEEQSGKELPESKHAQDSNGANPGASAKSVQPAALKTVQSPIARTSREVPSADSLTHVLKQGQPEPVLKVSRSEETAKLYNQSDQRSGQQPAELEYSARCSEGGHSPPHGANHPAAGKLAEERGRGALQAGYANDARSVSPGYKPSSAGPAQRGARDAPESRDMVLFLMKQMRSLLRGHSKGQFSGAESPASEQSQLTDDSGKARSASLIAMRGATAAGALNDAVPGRAHETDGHTTRFHAVRAFVAAQMSRPDLSPLVQFLQNALSTAGHAWPMGQSDAVASGQTRQAGAMSQTGAAMPALGGNDTAPAEGSILQNANTSAAAPGLPPAASIFLEQQLGRKELAPLIVFLNRHFEGGWALSGDIAAQIHAAHLGMPELASGLPRTIDIVLLGSLLRPTGFETVGSNARLPEPMRAPQEPITIQNFNGLTLNLFSSGRTFGSLSQAVDIHGIRVMSLPAMIAAARRAVHQSEHARIHDSDGDTDALRFPGFLYLLGKLAQKTDGRSSGKGKEDGLKLSPVRRLKDAQQRPRPRAKAKGSFLPEDMGHDEHDEDLDGNPKSPPLL